MKENKNYPCDNKKSQKIIEAKDKLIIDGKGIKGVVKSVTEEKQNGYSIVTLSIVTDDDDYELIPHQAFCGWMKQSNI